MPGGQFSPCKAHPTKEPSLFLFMPTLSLILFFKDSCLPIKKESLRGHNFEFKYALKAHEVTCNAGGSL